MVASFHTHWSVVCFCTHWSIRALTLGPEEGFDTSLSLTCHFHESEAFVVLDTVMSTSAAHIRSFRCSALHTPHLIGLLIFNIGFYVAQMASHLLCSQRWPSISDPSSSRS